MRILDKNTDFYDYLQNVYPDNTFTFDRTDSFVLTKDIMCSHMYVRRTYSHYKNENRKYHNFILLQICNTFWLFLAELTNIDEYDKVRDYEIELITKWRNYDKPRVLCSFDVVEFGYQVAGQLSSSSGFWSNGYDSNKVHEKANMLINLIDTNDFKIKDRINRHIIYHGNNEKTEKHIPLLKACGIANLIDPLDVFLAFEEYFSLEKTASERRDPVGSTNDDKIESHGFDKKISFRGKPANC